MAPITTMPGYRLARVIRLWRRALTYAGRSTPVVKVRQASAAISVWLNRGLAIQSAEERARHVAAVKRVVCDPELKDVHSWLHLNLIIIDSKAQSVLSLYSIALATLTIFYSSMGSKTPAFVIAAAVSALLVIVWSIIPLAKICFVYWSTTAEFDDPGTMMCELLRIRDERTLIIRKSVLKGGLSLLLFIAIFIWDAVNRVHPH